jgi:hypothetical protein
MWLYNAVTLEYWTSCQDNHIAVKKQQQPSPFFITTTTSDRYQRYLLSIDKRIIPPSLI